MLKMWNDIILRKLTMTFKFLMVTNGGTKMTLLSKLMD